MTTRITVCKWFSLLSLTNIGLILGSFFTLCYSSGLTILPVMLSSKLIFKKRTLEINDSVTRSPKIQPHRKTVIPIFLLAFPGGLVEKNPLANEGDIWDLGLIPGSGRFPQVGHGSPVQHSCLENPMNTGAWRATVHRASKSQTQLSTCTNQGFISGNQSVQFKSSSSEFHLWDQVPPFLSPPALHILP